MKRGKQTKFNERSPDSYKRQLKGIELRSGRRDPFIVFSLRNYDRNQGQTIKEWEDQELLSLALAKLQEVCNLTRVEATRQQIIKEYRKGDFPPESDFYHPKHIPADIAWCSMHIQGKECVIGYFEDNIFHVVFLDKEHRFWITEKKHT